MLQVLNTKQTATATAVSSANHGLEDHGMEIASLRCNNAMISLESLMTQVDGYVAKLEGFSQMHKLLSVMPNVSVESAALIEIASNLLSHDTDLDGSTDLIPSLEDYTQGLEDDDKGSGFGETAKAVGKAIIEAMKKIWAKLTELWNSIEDKIAKLKDSFTEVKEKIDSNDPGEAEAEIPVWAYNALIDPVSAEVTSFINKSKSFRPEYEVPEGKDAAQFYDEQLRKYLELFSDIAETKDDVIRITGVDSGKVITYKVAVFKDGKLTKGGVESAEDREKEEMKLVKVSSDQLKAGILRILKVIDELNDYFSKVSNKVPEVKDSLANDEVTSVKVSLELIRLSSFALSEVPGTIVSNYEYLHSIARKLVQAIDHD